MSHISTFRRSFASSAAAAATLVAVVLPVHADEVYVNGGLPGAMLGYAVSVSERTNLRADVSTLGSVSIDGREDGVDYKGTAKLNRAGLFGDWFVFAPGGFRVSGGVTFNEMSGDVSGRGNGEVVTVGNNAYLLTPADRINVQVKFPRVMPYVGVGWGHQPAGESGWGFVFDLGASIGKARVSGRASGPILSTADAQEDFQRELQEVRDKADKYPFVPQLSMGASYRF